MVYNTCPIFLIYENDEWINPLIHALEEEKMAFVKCNMKSRAIDFEMIPEHGIYLNRMSASSFIRGNRFIPEITMGFISLLEAHKKLIIFTKPLILLLLSDLKIIKSPFCAWLKTWSSKSFNAMEKANCDLAKTIFELFNKIASDKFLIAACVER